MTAEPFAIDEILGTGSTSTVVRARRVGEDRPVVVKVLQQELLQHEDILARTRDEARLLALIPHPHIVAIEALVVHRGHPLLVMEYIDGMDLGLLLRATREGIPAPLALEITRRTAAALDAANTRADADGNPLHVIHRDIKPSNLLLSITGQVKVVDFGLARADFSEREAHTDRLLLGSMGFVAPERYQEIEPTAAVDVYALGVTLLELLTARTVVFSRTQERHDAALLVHLDKIDLTAFDEASQTALRTLIQHMCAYAPSDRPDAAKVQSRCAELLTGRPVNEDLTQFAGTVIPDVRERNPATLPNVHPEWRQVSFLEEPEAKNTRLNWLFGWARRRA